ncbi:aquaporin-like protein [Thelephora ganbajun]|uniref:Aquaporin-like protein n=1 Tax=Thelephora ganbajun TaxID=370292 RepID=A0ACB6ZRH4_THEGA|nr:aquaporin-like protein [Thelephora ganbajun]
MPDNFVHFGDVEPRPGFLRAWERAKNRHALWFAECFAEFLGVFIFTVVGTGATLAYNLGSIAKLTGIGSLFSVGLSYVVGITLAVVICAPVSGAHLSPGVTIAAVIFKGFSPFKAVRYVIAQILGSFVACLVVYVQYHEQIKAATHALKLQGTFDRINFTAHGIAGSFAMYAPVGSSLKYVFFNEFVCTFLLGMVIWACIDPTNFYVPTSLLPVYIALGYGMIIWAFDPAGLATNTARDVGGRMMAIAVWGPEASGGAYAAIAALTNILAICVALVVYEALFADSSRVISPDRRIQLGAKMAESEHRNGRSTTNVSESYGSTEKVNA